MLRDDLTSPFCHRRPRLLRAAAVAAVLPLLALTACGGDQEAAPPADEPSASPEVSPEASPSPDVEAVEPSDNLDAVTVTGEFGEDPEVEIESPWAIDETRDEVLSEGDGATLSATSTAELDYVGVNGRTGEVFDSSFERGAPAVFPLDGVVPGFALGLEGQSVGSRVVIAMPGTDGYDASGGNPQAGIELGDTLVFVVDILATQLEGPEGEEVAAEPGLPTVTGPLEAPEISVGDEPAPSELVVQPLIEGTGTEITETDVVTADFTAVDYATGEVVQSSYGAEPATAPLSGLLPSWQQALVGQPVGSRVLLVVPAGSDYPDGSEDAGVTADQTLVYVIDLLFSQPGQPTG